MRRFELGERHWTIRLDRQTVDIVWGEPGQLEQRHSRRFGSDDLARQFVETQIARQRARGYVEVGPISVAPAAAAEPPRSRSIRFEVAGETRTGYRRYPRPARFAELAQRDREVVEWTGELEAPHDPARSQRRHTRHPTVAAATAAYDEAVATIRGEDAAWRMSWAHSDDPGELAELGAAPPVRTAPVAVEPALEAQCVAADHDPAPWSVYADWLLEQGDPLGELATSPDAEGARLLADHLRALGLDANQLIVERRHGFPRRATLRVPDLDDAGPRALADAARALRSCGVGRFVDELRLGLAGFSDRNDWAPTLRALAESPSPERIRWLAFDAYDAADCEISWVTMGELGGLFAPFTGLEHLHLKSGAGGVLGELDLPNLRTFIRESGGLADVEIASIVGARWPRLEHLEIWFGSPSYGATSTVDAIRPLLDGEGPPRLRHLGIVNCAWVEDAIEALAHSALLPRLSSLDLSRGILARRGVELLRQYAPRFRHLASIDVSANLLRDDEVARIREVLDNTIPFDQRDRELDDYEEDEADGEVARYVAVGE